MFAKRLYAFGILFALPIPFAPSRVHLDHSCIRCADEGEPSFDRRPVPALHARCRYESVINAREFSGSRSSGINYRHMGRVRVSLEPGSSLGNDIMCEMVSSYPRLDCTRLRATDRTHCQGHHQGALACGHQGQLVCHGRGRQGRGRLCVQPNGPEESGGGPVCSLPLLSSLSLVLCSFPLLRFWSVILDRLLKKFRSALRPSELDPSDPTLPDPTFSLRSYLETSGFWKIFPRICHYLGLVTDPKVIPTYPKPRSLILLALGVGAGRRRFPLRLPSQRFPTNLNRPENNSSHRFARCLS